MIKKPFIYGRAAGGDNFTDRTREAHRLALDFENGINTIIISSRRMGKTSLVRRVQEQFSGRDDLRIVFMDIYDCRDEYDFYERFAACVVRDTAGHLDRVLAYVKEFLVRLTPKVSFAPEANSEFSLSLGITPDNYSPEEILDLPQRIARDKGYHIVVCIDEFQQVGSFRDSITFQKRMRGVWQHQQDVSYCLFGSKRHLMSTLFQDSNMPFFHFGEMMFLKEIPIPDWVRYITSRFEIAGKHIDESLAERICLAVKSQSSYVQQLSWNVMANTIHEATEESLMAGIEETIEQCSALFQQKLNDLSHYQMNLVRAMRDGLGDGFTSAAVVKNYNLGSKSNVSRILQALVDKELIDNDNGKWHFADAVFELWLRRNMG